MFRCLLFTADPAAAEVLSQALSGIGVERQHCSTAEEARTRIDQELFQMAVIDWDLQPHAAQLLSSTRQRKPAERPLTLVLVSHDVDVPKALQAGANSIVRKPVLLNQAIDTLTTARDLLRARQESGRNSALPKPVAPSAVPASIAGTDATLRAGEFLVVPPSAPGGQFITETELPELIEPSAGIPLDPLSELEPVAARVQASTVPEEPPAPSPPGETRGLEWFLKMRAGRVPQGSVQQAGGSVAGAAPAPEAPKIDLVSYEQTAYAPVASDTVAPAKAHPLESVSDQTVFSQPSEHNEVDAAFDGGVVQNQRTGFHLGRGTLAFALLLAGIAITLAPQAPWHQRVISTWIRAQRATHAWLNPQPVAPPQAPITHENFAQAGDEYKLPVAENIPDATTDPSQIRVEPVIDPTAKKANDSNSNDANSNDANSNDANSAAAGNLTTTDPGANSGDPSQSPALLVQEVPSAQGDGKTGTPGASANTSATPVNPPAAQPPRQIVLPVSTPLAIVPRPVAPTAPAHYTSAPNSGGNPAIPSSLKSQMASMAPDASGNKPIDAAMPAIEPVSVPEPAERALVTQQSPIAYPPGINGQQGTVALQVLIARDGTVQDAKFLQGSLAFARAAIEGVRQWKFKPYILNGRPVSVQTSITVNFKPGS